MGYTLLSMASLLLWLTLTSIGSLWPGQRHCYVASEARFISFGDFRLRRLLN
jgi:hypothetical protein